MLTIIFGADIQFRGERTGHIKSVLLDLPSRRALGLRVQIREVVCDIPADLVAAAFPEAVHVNTVAREVSASRIEATTELSAQQSVRWPDARSGSARLRGAIINPQDQSLETLIVNAGLGPLRRLPANHVDNICPHQLLVEPGCPGIRLLAHYRADSEILDDVIEEAGALGMLLPERSLSLQAYVDDGLVRLQGNVRAPAIHRKVTSRIQSVPGIVGIQDELVEDQELETRVAAALARDPSTKGSIRRVVAWCGDVELTTDGQPHDELAQAVRRAAAAVPGVRSANVAGGAPGQVEQGRAA